MINEEVKNKLGNFNSRIENEKKQKLLDEEQRKKQEREERDLAACRQEEMKSYVENKMRMITGLNSFVLTKQEVEEDLSSLYDALNAMDLVQEEKKKRNIDFQAKKMVINGETVFFDSDIVLEAQIRESFVRKAKELLNYYEQDVMPKIVDFETFNKYYFAGINKIMVSMCELYYKFLSEFDAEDDELDSICNKYKEKWMSRDYSSLRPLYNKVTNAMNEAGVKINEKYEYDDSYEPTIYNGFGISNAIDAKFQSEMIGIGINFVRMLGSNIRKYISIEKIEKVTTEVFRELYKDVIITSRYIYLWVEDLIRDAINTLMSKKIIELSIIQEYHVRVLKLYLLRQTWGTNIRMDSEKMRPIVRRIFYLYPFCLKPPCSDEQFIEFFDMLEFLNIDYFLTAEYNICPKIDMQMCIKDAKDNLNVIESVEKVNSLKNKLVVYELLEKIEYNDQIKEEIAQFLSELSKLIQQIEKNQEERKKRREEESKKQEEERKRKREEERKREEKERRQEEEREAEEKESKGQEEECKRQEEESKKQEEKSKEQEEESKEQEEESKEQEEESKEQEEKVCTRIDKKEVLENPQKVWDDLMFSLNFRKRFKILLEKTHSSISNYKIYKYGYCIMNEEIRRWLEEVGLIDDYILYYDKAILLTDKVMYIPSLNQSYSLTLLQEITYYARDAKYQGFVQQIGFRTPIEYSTIGCELALLINISLDTLRDKEYDTKYDKNKQCCCFCGSDDIKAGIINWFCNSCGKKISPSQIQLNVWYDLWGVKPDVKDKRNQVTKDNICKYAESDLLSDEKKDYDIYKRYIEKVQSDCKMEFGEERHGY